MGSRKDASIINTQPYPRIVPFIDVPPASSTRGASWIDERGALEMPDKGWICIHVETGPSVYHEICFYDHVRLRQEMEANIADGIPCFAETSPFVVLAEVTVEGVEQSVQYLWEKDYFSYWKPDNEFKPHEGDIPL